MKAARREVPLPSQEGKKGAMQYALYVLSLERNLEGGIYGGDRS
jgi:hypothetical protein